MRGEGAVTESHAKVLSRCVANLGGRDRFAEDEAELVALATKLNADRLATRVDAWIRLHDQDGVEPHDPEHDLVSANRVGDRVKINADLGLETDRKSVVEGKSVAVRVDLGGSRISEKKNKTKRSGMSNRMQQQYHESRYTRSTTK